MNPPVEHGLKRAFDAFSTQLKNDNNKRQRTENIPLDNKVHILFAEVFYLNRLEDYVANRVILSRNDLSRFVEQSEGPGTSCQPFTYVQIASRVFKAEVGNEAQDGSLLIPFFQAKYLRDFLKDPHSKQIAISSFEKETIESKRLESVVFEIECYDEDENSTESPIILPLQKLKEQAIACLSGHYIVNGQSFVLPYDSRHFTLKVKSLECKSTAPNMTTKKGARVERSNFADALKRPSLIHSRTKFDFEVPEHANIVISDGIFEDSHSNFEFSISLKKKENRYLPTLTPLALDLDELSKYIKQQKGHDGLAIGDTITKYHDATWDLCLKFDSIDYSGKSVKEGAVSTKIGYEKLYKLMPDQKMTFKACNATEIVFTSGLPQKANQMDFKVVKVFSKYSKHKSKKNMVYADELKAAVQGIRTPLTAGQKSKLSLSCGDVLVKFVRGAAENPVNTNTSLLYEKWVAGPDTHYSFSTSSAFVSLVDTHTHMNIAKLHVQVKPSDIHKSLTASEEELLTLIKKKVDGPLLKNQEFTVRSKDGENLVITIKDMEFNPQPIHSPSYGIIGKFLRSTEVVFSHDKGQMSLCSKAETRECKDLKEELFKLGLGGIDKHLEQIDEEIIQPWGPRRELYKKRGIQPQKGLLLFGPPGTGKTTLALKLADILGCAKERCIRITSTEIYNKYVGESESNVRKLFEVARKAQDELKDKSPLHMIIVDEIDGILSARSGDTNKWRDSVVNQFLGEMDGINQLKNILVVGMTNRLDQMDPAALRPGRFGLKIEIGVPDAPGRERIFEIYLRKHRENKCLGDIDVKKLVELTPNYTGADIEYTVQKALFINLARTKKLDMSSNDPKILEKLKISQEDLEKALKTKETKPSDDSYAHLYL